jgi:hypothetical protein
MDILRLVFETLDATRVWFDSVGLTEGQECQVAGYRER